VGFVRPAAAAAAPPGIFTGSCNKTSRHFVKCLVQVTRESHSVTLEKHDTGSEGVRNVRDSRMWKNERKVNICGPLMRAAWFAKWKWLANSFLTGLLYFIIGSTSFHRGLTQTVNYEKIRLLWKTNFLKFCWDSI